MKNVTNILSTTSSVPARFFSTPCWSSARLSELETQASGASPAVSALDARLALALLLFSKNEFERSELAILQSLTENLESCSRDEQIFISLLTALFLIQRSDLVAAMLLDRFGFPTDFKLAFELGSVGVGMVRWDIAADRSHQFVFDTEVFTDESYRIEILAFYWSFPMLSNYAGHSELEIGSVFLNRTDVGKKPGLAYCDNRPEYFLVPDCIFVPSRGYQYARKVLRERDVPWGDRAEVAFWRGGTTGVPTSPGRWQSLERIRLCEIARSHEKSGLMDVGISSIVQFESTVAAEISKSGLMRGRVSWEYWGQYKYLIDIDGNSSPWSNLIQRLLSGSTVLKVESRRGLRQWFYDELVPWKNYVPIAADMSDLFDKVCWLKANDSFARKVARNGLLLAESMTYERELQRSAQIIAGAFRYHRGDHSKSAPYGSILRSSN